MKLDEFLAHPTFSIHKTDVESFRDEFIEKGCEMFLWENRVYSSEQNSYQYNGKIDIHPNISSFLEKLSDFADDELYFIYPEDFSPNFLMAKELSKNAKRSYVLDNIFIEDDTKNWISVFDVNDVENLAMMFNAVYYNIPFKGDNYGGYKMFGKGLMYYADCLQNNGRRLKIRGTLTHFQGNGIRRDINPRYILESRRVIEMLLRLNYFKDEYELFINMKDYLLPFLQDSYLKTRAVLGEKIVQYRNTLVDLKNRMIADGIIARKWKTEQALYTLTKKEYDDAVFQYRPRWLEPQSLDIYIPSLNIAIEYQGQQHYQSIDFFGGEKAFEYRKKLDARKKQLCLEHNVKLIEWPYTDDISVNNLNFKILETKR